MEWTLRRRWSFTPVISVHTSECQRSERHLEIKPAFFLHHTERQPPERHIEIVLKAYDRTIESKGTDITTAMVIYVHVSIRLY